MVLLIDANIILDVLLNRPEFVKESSLVWKLCETEQAKGYISALTFANLVYIMRKQLTPEKIEDVLQRLGLIFEFSDLTSADVSKAAALHWADFEDAVQSVTAERIHANYIITRNVRDFTKSSVMAFTPAELLARARACLSSSLPHSSAGRLCLFRALRYQHLLESAQDIFSCFLDFMWYYQGTISKRGDSLCPPAATPNLPVSSARHGRPPG